MPFLGVVHANARQILASYIPYLPPHAHIVCSGNFSIETTLRLNGYSGLITGCDVSLYTCSLGAALAGGLDIPLSVNADLFPELAPLADFLGDQDGRAAAVAVALDALEFHRQTTAYARRNYAAYVRRLPELCEKTKGRIAKKRVEVRLNEFHPQDGWVRVSMIPTDGQHVIITFPPTYSKGYERMYRLLGELFRWDPPLYRELTSGVEFAAQIKETGCPWIIGAEKPTPELEALLGRPIAIAPRGSGVSISFYSNLPALQARVMRRETNTREPGFARLTDRDEITAASRLSIHRIEGPEANYIRAMYSSIAVNQSEGAFNYGVAVDGKLIGVVTYHLPSLQQIEPDGKGSREECLYMIADLAIASDRYPRLSKLVVMAAASAEMQQDLERRLIRRCTWSTTTAFSKHPASMKYRGIFELHSRKEAPNGFRLNYFARMGQYTLQETLDRWIKKHSQPSPLSKSSC